MGSIGENIRRLRESAGLSMNQLAQMIGKSRSSISQYEQGKVIPRMGTVEDMARVFGVSKMEILNDRVEYYAINMEPTETDELMRLYRSMTDEGKRQLMDYARYVAEQHPKNQAMGIA